MTLHRGFLHRFFFIYFYVCTRALHLLVNSHTERMSIIAGVEQTEIGGSQANGFTDSLPAQPCPLIGGIGGLTALWILPRMKYGSFHGLGQRIKESNRPRSIEQTTPPSAEISMYHEESRYIFEWIRVQVKRWSHWAT